MSNWPLYIDKATPKGWKKAENAKLSYSEDINENDEFFAKVRQQLEAGQGIDRDLVVLTDWMAARWVDAGYTEKIDKRNVPNAKNLLPALQHPGFDRNRDYTLPWQSGITAIGYNPKKTGGRLTSINDLFDPRFKGRVSFISDWHDSASLVLLGMGKKTATATKDDLLAAIEKLDKANKAGRSAGSPATTTPRTSPRGTSGPAPPTPATSSSCSPTTPSCGSSSPRREPSPGRTT